MYEHVWLLGNFGKWRKKLSVARPFITHKFPVVDKMYDDNGSEGGPKGSFEIYKSEGDVLFKQMMYTKAIECYNTVKY